jgi:outer membrane murein-binding lipoprotein Lpp
MPDNTQDINNIKLPYIIRDAVLFSPGEHNNLRYTEHSIEYAYQNTDWNPKTLALYLDHEDNYTFDKTGKKTIERGGSVRNWVGDVKNLSFRNNTIRGDLYIVDRDTATKFAYGATFGISPRGKAMLQGGQNLTDKALVENFAIVINPAQKTAYINNGDDELLLPYDNQITYFAMSEVDSIVWEGEEHYNNQTPNNNKMDATQMKEQMLSEITKPLSDLTAQVTKLSQDIAALKAKEEEEKKLKEAACAKDKDKEEDKKKPEAEDEEPDEEDKEMADALASLKTPEEMASWADLVKKYGIKGAMAKRKGGAAEKTEKKVEENSEKVSQLEAQVKELRERLDTPNPRKSATLEQTGQGTVNIDNLSDRELDMRFIGMLRSLSGQEDDSIVTIQRERGINI